VLNCDEMRSPHFWTFARATIGQTGVIERLALRERVVARGDPAEQLVVDPEVGDRLREVLAHRELRLPDEVTEAGGRELLRARARDHVLVGAHRFLEAVATGEQRRGRQYQGSTNLHRSSWLRRKRCVLRAACGSWAAGARTTAHATRNRQS
jgi:hypothetical protein